MTVLNLRRLENDQTDAFNLNQALSGDSTDRSSDRGAKSQVSISS